MEGGKYAGTGKMRKQKAVVELLCDRSSEEKRRTFSGRDDNDEDNEGGGSGDDEDSGSRRNKEAESTDDGKGGTLKFLDYDMVGDFQVLSLEWRTKYACEDAKSEEGGSGNGHWGFFTWFIIV